MSDFEWPPDEIAGQEQPPATPRKAEAPPQVTAPQAGVPVPLSAPQVGIPLPGPQPITADDLPALPVPPQRGQGAVPLPSQAIPVQPHTSPIPVVPQGTASLVPEDAFENDDEPAPLPRRRTPLTTIPTRNPAGAWPVMPAASGDPAPVSPAAETPADAGAPGSAASAFGAGSSAARTPAPPTAAPSASVAPSPATSTWPSSAAGATPTAWPASNGGVSAARNPAELAPPTVPTPVPLDGEIYLPTAEEFARRRAARPTDPVAHLGIQGALRKGTFGLVSLPPGQHEQELRRQTDLVRRNFGGLRQITVVNPKGGAGKTVAVLLLAMTFGRKRGGYVLAWDNNETQGTLGMRSQQDFHSRTVRDLLRDLGQFQGVNSRVGDLSQYVRAQGDGMFEVLASDESATAGEMLTADAFAEIREVVSRFYKLIMVDTGNNVRAENWQAAIDATDQLVVTMSARNDSAETAARMLDHLEQSGRSRLVRQAVTIVSLPPSRKEMDIPAIERHFAARTRAVLIAPYERMLDTGEPIDYARLSQESQDAWLAIAAAVAEGL